MFAVVLVLCAGAHAEDTDAEGGRALTAGELAALAAGARAQPFETEVSRLMDILVHSLYARPEVFLRELVSNGVDALDRVRFLALTNASVLAPRRELHVLVRADPAAHTLHIRDTGIGMTAAELARNLGTIARSGTVDFLRRAQQQQAQHAGLRGAQERDALAGLIGQFGVGFYSAFLVADRVAVVSKSADDPVQHVWQSTAGGAFTVAPDPRGDTLGRGTEVVLHLRDDCLEWLEPARLRDAIRRYAQFVTFPVKLLVPHEQDDVPEEDNKGNGDETATKDTAGGGAQSQAQKPRETERQRRIREELLRDDVFGGEEDEEFFSSEDGDDNSENDGNNDNDETSEKQEEQEEKQDEQKKTSPKKGKKIVWEWEVLNSLAPIWTRNPRYVAESEYVEFYKVLAHTHHAPLAWTHFSVEGTTSFRALLYLPHELRLDVWAPPGAGASTGADATTTGTSAGNTPPPTAAPGVRLFVRHVLVTEQQVGALLPPWLRFVVGVVDSDDLPVNVGRDAVQGARAPAAVRHKLVRKALALMAQLRAADPAPGGNYSRFHRRFASALKLGAAEDRENRAALLDLLLFDSTFTVNQSRSSGNGDSDTPGTSNNKEDNKDEEDENTLPKTTLREYVERLRAQHGDEPTPPPTATTEERTAAARRVREAHQILYLAGASLADVQRSPLLERAVEAGREVLLLTDPMDEYLVAAVRAYEIEPDENAFNKDNDDQGNSQDGSNKRPPKRVKYIFVDLARNENDIGATDGQEERWARRVEPLAAWMRGAIGVPQLERVAASTKLARSPAAVTAGDQGLTGNLERLARAQAVRPPGQQAALDAARRAPTRVLELNARHPLVRAMTERYNSGRVDATLRRAAKLLYHTALVASGYPDDAPDDLAETAYALLDELLGVSSDDSTTSSNTKEEL